jgi:hypothetical protein
MFRVRREREFTGYLQHGSLPGDFVSSGPECLAGGRVSEGFRETSMRRDAVAAGMR